MEVCWPSGKTKFYKAICSIIAIAFSAFFLLQSFALLQLHASKLPVLLLCIAVVALLLYSLYLFITYLLTVATKKMFRTMLVVFGILCFVFQLLYVRSIITFVGWDAGEIFFSAHAFANTGEIATDYFLRWKNNSLFFLTEAFILSLFPGASPMLGFSILCGVNILIIDFSAILMILAAKKLFGVKAAVIATLFAVPLLFFNPNIATPYTDVYALPFPILAFTFFVKAKETASKPKRLVWIALVGFFAVIGYHFKPTSILMLFAILIVCGVRMLGKFNKKLFQKALSWLLAVLVGCAGAYACATAVVNTAMSGYFDEDKLEAQAFPMTLWLSMGLYHDGDMYGSWNAEDVIPTLELPTQKEKKDYNLQTARARLEKMGPGGYLEFLYGKARFTFGDGTFFMGLEGNHFASGPFADDKTSHAILEHHTPGSNTYELKTVVSNAPWFLLLLALGCSVFLRGGKKYDGNVAVLKLSLLALVVFLMLFETRSRQLISYLPIFLLVASGALVNARQLWQNLRKRITKHH